MREADAYLLVSAEYNHSIPPGEFQDDNYFKESLLRRSSNMLNGEII